MMQASREAATYFSEAATLFSPSVVSALAARQAEPPEDVAPAEALESHLGIPERNQLKSRLAAGLCCVSAIQLGGADASSITRTSGFV
jgi:hypothetical protein